MAIPREAGRITYSTNIRAMKRIPVSDIQKAVIVGSLLGDACLHDNWSKTNYRLQIRHSKDQEAYVQWKYEIFKNLVLTPPQYYEHTRSVWFRTISHRDLSNFYVRFYQNTKKIIPSDIWTWIANPLVMAVWFMDDGNAVRRKNGAIYGFHLNTQSFTVAENEELKIILASVWKLNCSLQKNNGYIRLYIHTSSADAFRKIVGPHILPSMKYKLAA